MLHRRNLWLGTGWLLVLAVVWQSLTPKPYSPDINHFDKFGHVMAYLGLMAWWGQIDRNHCRLALAFVLMGLGLEIAQSYTGHRFGDVFDAAANTLGVGIGGWLSRRYPAWLSALDRRL